MHSSLSRRCIIAVLSLSLASPLPSIASTYEALCGDTACTIGLDANGISSPTGFIPTARIAQWFTGGEESYNAGAGTAGALGAATVGAIGGGLLLGPIGLIGGLIGGGIAGSKAGKSADLFFNVVGYNQEGKKTTLSFRFVNPKPANRMRMELPMFTGLAMGQTRSLDELRTALASSGSNNSTPALPERLEPSQPIRALGTTASGHDKSQSSTSHKLNTQRAAALPDQLTPAATEFVSSPAVGVQQQETEWRAYLKTRGLDQWAQKNPKLAEQLRQRLYPSL